MALLGSSERNSTSKTRFLQLALVVLCLMINWANILTFNFTVICMQPSNNSTSENKQHKQQNLTDDYFVIPPSDGSSIGALKENVDKNGFPMREFTGSEKSQAMAFVAAGALVANFPIVTAINWYGPRHLFTLLGLLGAFATALIPYAIKLGWGWFLAARMLQGIAFAGDMATFGHFITHWTYYKQYAFFTATLCAYVQLAPLFTNPVSGLLCQSFLGWPGVYYFHALVACLLFVLFYIFYRNHPEEHSLVNRLEREKIGRGRESQDDRRAQRFVPYGRIFCSPAAWAVFVGGIGNFIGINLLYQFTPTYLYKVQGFQVMETGFMAALPPLGEACMKEMAGIINDRIPHRLMSETTKTKMFNSIAFLSMAALLVAVSFVPEGNGKLALFLITAAAFMLGFNIGGFYKSGSMIAGPYSPFVMGQLSIAMTITILLVPLIVNPLTPDNTRQQWALAFYVMAALMVLCNIFYCCFASAELQSWGTAQHFSERMEQKRQKRAIAAPGQVHPVEERPAVKEILRNGNNYF